jgi:hypothetical protein
MGGGVRRFPVRAKLSHQAIFASYDFRLVPLLDFSQSQSLPSFAFPSFILFALPSIFAFLTVVPLQGLALCP